MRRIRGLLVLLVVILAGCMPARFNGNISQPVQAPSNVVGMVLPLSATGNAGQTAQSLQKAADLALSELNTPDAISLRVVDGYGTPEGTAAATQTLLNEGAQLIIGPVFSSSVTAAKSVAATRNVPIMAFSTNASVAGGGAYLLSFLPQSDVSRVIAYSAQQNKRKLVAYLPQSEYGLLVQRALEGAASRNGVTILKVVNYPLDRVQLNTPVMESAEAAREADALFIPDAPDVAELIVRALRTNGVDTAPKLLIGSGLWDDQKAQSSATLRGGVYAAPNPKGFQDFTARYRARYNQDPARIASLAYDAVRLAAALSQNGGLQNASQMLTSPSGFAGVDGVFRFTPDGLSERGLAVLQLSETGKTVVSPAPTTFGF